MKLKELAFIQMGYSFRSRVEPSENGDTSVIQMKDLGRDNIVCCDQLARVHMESLNEKHFVQSGDLIFRSRGMDITAAILLKNLQKTVVSAPLLRIRIKTEDLLPEYLNWYIGQRDAQMFFSSRVGGSMLKMINKKVLEELDVLVPPLNKQRNIVDIFSLACREKRISEELLEQKERYIKVVLMEYAKSNR